MKMQLKIILAFAAVYLIWGSTYLAILYVINDIPPFLMSGMRFMLAGSLLFSWCLWKNEKLPEFKAFLINAACGILMLFGGTGAVAWCEQYLPSGLAAVIVTTTPFWFLILDRNNWNNNFTSTRVIPGLLLGFGGVVLLIGAGADFVNGTFNNRQTLVAIAVLIAGGIAWAGGSLLSKYKLQQGSLKMNAAIQLLVAGIASFNWSIFSGEASGFYFAKVSQSAWFAFFYLVIAGSLVAYLCYLWLLKVKPAAQVSTYVYVNPVVAVMLGAVVAGEAFTALQSLALGLILGGVLMINSARYKSQEPCRLSTT